MFSSLRDISLRKLKSLLASALLIVMLDLDVCDELLSVPILFVKKVKLPLVSALLIGMLNLDICD